MSWPPSGGHHETGVDSVVLLRGHAPPELAPNAQALQDRLVTIRVPIAQVGQKPATLGDEGQQPFAGTMILAMRLEVPRQQRNSLAQQCNLYFRRPCVGFVALIGGNNLPLSFNRQCHSLGKTPCLLFISFWYAHRIARKPGPLGTLQKCNTRRERSGPLNCSTTAFGMWWKRCLPT